jgi:hypothetical protein
LDLMLCRSKIHRIRRPCFKIDGCAALWAVALKRTIFVRQKGLRTLILA